MVKVKGRPKRRKGLRRIEGRKLASGLREEVDRRGRELKGGILVKSQKPRDQPAALVGFAIRDDPVAGKVWCGTARAAERERRKQGSKVAPVRAGLSRRLTKQVGTSLWW